MTPQDFSVGMAIRALGLRRGLDVCAACRPGGLARSFALGALPSARVLICTMETASGRSMLAIARSMRQGTPAPFSGGRTTLVGREEVT
jgi:hypothetical protein